MLSGATMMYPGPQDQKLFNKEQYSNQYQTTGYTSNMFDQQVPSTRTVDFIKTEVKNEVDTMPSNSEHQLPNFMALDESFYPSFTSPATTQNNVSYSTSGGINLHTPTTSISSFCRMDSTDTLNTPTPLSSNSINGLKWGDASSLFANTNSIATTNNIHNNRSSVQFQSLPSLPDALLSPPVHQKMLKSLTPPPPSSLTMLASPQAQTPQSSSFSPPFSISSFTASSVTSSSQTQTLPVFSAISGFEHTPSQSTVTSTPASTLSSMTLPSGSFNTELTTHAPNSPLASPAATTTVSQNQTSTFITNERAGSGCVLVSNENSPFLNGSPQHALPDSSRDYIDLDNPPYSFFDESEVFMDLSDKKLTPLKDTTISMINANFADGISADTDSNDLLNDPELRTFHMVQDTWRKDTNYLGIPNDPMQWTDKHVQRWITFACQTNNCPDISSQLFPLEGPTLCSMPTEELNQLGKSGEVIAVEINLYKATSFIPQDSTFPEMNLSHVTPQQTDMTSPSVSPVPSHCSNNSQSSSCGFSTPSDHSGDEADLPTTTSSNHNKTPSSAPSRPHHHKQSIKLWEFLRELLVTGSPAHSDIIRWVNRNSGVFKIEDSKKVAELWGKRKNRPLMNYDKMSRSIRQYYKKSIIRKTDQSKRLVYQFCDGYL